MRRLVALVACLVALLVTSGARGQYYPAGGSSGGGVTSVTGTAPIVSSGGTTPAISVSLGTAGQFFATNAAASAAVWVSCSGDVACSTTTVGQRNITGIGTLAGGTVTLGTPSTGVNFTGATATSGAGANQTFTGSPPTTTGATGSFVFNFGAPASGTVEGALVVQRGATNIIQAQALVGTASTGAIYLGLGATAPNGINATLYGQANGFTQLNSLGTCTSVGVCLNFSAAGNDVAGIMLGGMTIGTSSATQTGAAFGNNELGIKDQSVSDVAAIAGGTKMMSIAGVLTSVGPGGFQTQMGLTGGGSHSTQARQITQQADQLTVTHSSGAVTISTVPLATSATHMQLVVRAECRATTLFTGGAVGDAWSATTDVLVKNIGGTLTLVGTATSLATHQDTVLSNTLSVTTSGTNILVQITPPVLAAGIEDCTSLDEGVIN